MGYAILPALIPEIEEVYNAYFAAFRGEKMGEIMVNILFPSGTETPEFRKAHAAGTLAWWNQSKVQYTYKCVDTETGEIIGMALGDIHIQGRTEEERRFQGVGWLEGEQRAKAEAVLKPLHEAREKIFADRPHIYVHVIAVHPKHQGRKAGALWCQWGIELCNSTGLPLYFEASPSTYKLYEKMGYETLDEKIVHKAALMGTEAEIEVPLMVKMPASAGGATYKEWAAAGFPTLSELRRSITEGVATENLTTVKAPTTVAAVEVKDVAA